jgi:hypothetical protein
MDVLSYFGRASASAQQRVGMLSADFDKVSRWRMGVFVGAKRSAGSAIMGSSL